MTFDHEVQDATLTRWEDAGLSPRATANLVYLDETVFCLNAVSRAIEADEQAAAAADRDELDYIALPAEVRRELRAARQVLQYRLERYVADLHRALVKQAGTS